MVMVAGSQFSNSWSDGYAGGPDKAGNARGRRLDARRSRVRRLLTYADRSVQTGTVVESEKEDKAVAIEDTASDLVDAFGSFDRARLIRMSETDRARQLDARQLLYDYVNALWADVERAGERPAVGEKYQAFAAMRELITGLRTTAFEAVYNTPE
jgi:hypothetical protein